MDNGCSECALDADTAEFPVSFLADTRDSRGKCIKCSADHDSSNLQYCRKRS